MTTKTTSIQARPVVEQMHQVHDEVANRIFFFATSCLAAKKSLAVFDSPQCSKYDSDFLGIRGSPSATTVTVMPVHRDDNPGGATSREQKCGNHKHCVTVVVHEAQTDTLPAVTCTADDSDAIGQALEEGVNKKNKESKENKENKKDKKNKKNKRTLACKVTTAVCITLLVVFLGLVGVFVAETINALELSKDDYLSGDFTLDFRGQNSSEAGRLSAVPDSAIGVQLASSQSIPRTAPLGVQLSDCTCTAARGGSHVASFALSDSFMITRTPMATQNPTATLLFHVAEFNVAELLWFIADLAQSLVSGACSSTARTCDQ